MFRSLRNYQCFALALCLLLLNQQVIGKVEGRRRYESAFEDLFNKGKSAVNQLLMFHRAVKADDKELKQNTYKAIQFVKANPGKVGIAVGLVASSWLLYQSIKLAGEVDKFFDEIDELKLTDGQFKRRMDKLKGQFKEYYHSEVPKLNQLFKQIRYIADYSDQEKQKEHFSSVFEELLKLLEDLQNILKIVDDVMEDLYKAKNDAVISTALSGTIVVFAGAALFVGGPVTIPAAMWYGGVGGTLAMSSVSTTFSLKNAYDLENASAKLKNLKKDLKRLIDQVMVRMKDIIQFV